MSKFLIMCVVLYIINKVAYWHEDRKSKQANKRESAS